MYDGVNIYGMLCNMWTLLTNKDSYRTFQIRDTCVQFILSVVGLCDFQIVFTIALRVLKRTQQILALLGGFRMPDTAPLIKLLWITA